MAVNNKPNKIKSLLRSDCVKVTYALFFNVVAYYNMTFKHILNNLYIHNVACRDPLLGSDRDTDNETTSAARQQILNKQQLNYNRRTVSSTRPIRRYYNEDSWSSESVVSCEVSASGQRREHRS
jgi:hypothetical protein